MPRQSSSNTSKIPQLTEIAGWYGMITILLAFFLVSYEKVTATSALYLWFNITGSAGICIQAFYKKVWPPAVLNLIFALIAISALFR